jgi:hypothetical protein
VSGTSTLLLWRETVESTRKRGATHIRKDAGHHERATRWSAPQGQIVFSFFFVFIFFFIFINFYIIFSPPLPPPLLAAATAAGGSSAGA